MAGSWKAIVGGIVLMWVLACGGGSMPDHEPSAGARTARSKAVQVFTYINTKGNSRVCKGNTATGSAVCASSSTRHGEVSEPGKPSSWTDNNDPIDWFAYDSPYPEGKNAGRYAFFVYINSSRKSRVCVGDTKTGSAICRDSTPKTSLQKTQPEWQIDSDHESLWFRFFTDRRSKSSGFYGFTSYFAHGKPRICVYEVDDAVAECVDGSFELGSAVGDAEPTWKIDESVKNTRWQYTETPPSKGPWQVFTYANNKGQSRVCKGDVQTSDAWCVASASARSTVAGSETPVWEPITDAHQWFHYDAEFAAKGDYQFFTYRNSKGLVRVCAGDAKAGAAICRDGASLLGSASSGVPKFEPQESGNIAWFQYFNDLPASGNSAFSTYFAHGKPRVCRYDECNGNAWCVDGSSSLANTTGRASPEFSVSSHLSPKRRPQDIDAYAVGTHDLLFKAIAVRKRQPWNAPGRFCCGSQNGSR